MLDEGSVGVLGVPEANVVVACSGEERKIARDFSAA